MSEEARQELRAIAAELKLIRQEVARLRSDLKAVSAAGLGYSGDPRGDE